MGTEDNLKAAFAGESQANRTYLAFAEKAEQEGKKGVAVLFRAVAEAEKVHALNHLRLMKKINSTAENLKQAISGENYEHTKMYPKFIEEAYDDVPAKNSFNYANKVEQVHENLYKEALEKTEKGEDLSVDRMFVCRVCGYTSKEKPASCPICGATEFKEVE